MYASHASSNAPAGRFAIQDKQVNPVWSVPNSPWAGELQGTTVDGGSAANPLKARWMGIANGVGIHGTGEDYSIGTAASHGCIRMHVPDVIDLFKRVPVGAPVLYLEQVTYLADGRQIEYSDVWIRGDRLKLTSLLTRPPRAA